MREILKEYNYDDVYLMDNYTSFDNNIIKIFEAYNTQNDCECYLKIINKEKLKLGDYDFLLEQIKKEEEISKLCKCDSILNLNRKIETQNYIIFEYEYYEESLLDYMNENGELKYEKRIF